jgi:hypothetical protein
VVSRCSLLGGLSLAALAGGSSLGSGWKVESDAVPRQCGQESEREGRGLWDALVDAIGINWVILTDRILAADAAICLVNAVRQTRRAISEQITGYLYSSDPYGRVKL